MMYCTQHRPPSPPSSPPPFTSLAQSNLATLLAYCYSCGLVGADLCYSLLQQLCARFEEADVALMVVLLNCVGLQLRTEDPAAMKAWVLGCLDRAAVGGWMGEAGRCVCVMGEAGHCVCV